MDARSEATLLRIFIRESEQRDGKPLYEALVLAARDRGLAGATVLRGIMGFGKSSRVHTAKWLVLSADLPIVVEIVDTEDKIREFLPRVDELVEDGLATLEQVTVVRQGPRPGEGG
jgi:PII-like signaling protein